MKNRKIKFIVIARLWHDCHGNTYHSVNVANMKTGTTIKSNPMIYGYDEQFKHTALKLMEDAKWIPIKYRNGNSWMYEPDNNYPIYWDVQEGLKRDMINNVL